MCARALAVSVKTPVDSMTTSTPRSPHGRAAGACSVRASTMRSPIRIAPGSAVISPGNRLHKQLT